MKWLALLLFLAAGAVWGLAQLRPDPDEPLPERLRGEYVFYRFEPPSNVASPNPLRPWQEVRYRFNEDRTYLVRGLAAGGNEMWRKQGLIGVAGDRAITLTQVSENATELREPTLHFLIRWEKDKQGEYLLLVGDPEPYEYYLRPVN